MGLELVSPESSHSSLGSRSCICFSLVVALNIQDFVSSRDCDSRNKLKHLIYVQSRHLYVLDSMQQMQNPDPLQSFCDDGDHSNYTKNGRKGRPTGRDCHRGKYIFELFRFKHVWRMNVREQQKQNSTRLFQDPFVHETLQHVDRTPATK